MKTNCRALKASFLITFITAIAILIIIPYSLEIDCKLLDIIINILIGILCSAFVTLFIYIPLYRTSKTELLEKFLNEANRLFIEFYKIEYLFCEYKEENVVSYIDELNKEERLKKTFKNGKYPIDINVQKYKNMLA